jgi:probable HAF family extracellular repeat protein
MTDLGTLGGRISRGVAINSAGQVTGSAQTAGDATDHVFLYSDGVMTDLNTLIPADSGWILQNGTAINDRGQITGYGAINGEEHAFLLTPVAYNFVGFLQPVDNPPTVNLAKAGQTLAEQWQLLDVDTGAPVSDPDSVTALTTYSVACGAWSDTATHGLDQVSAGASGLQYLGNGTWQFNWKTDKNWANTCRTAVLTLNDGSTYSAWWQFTK